MTLLESTALMTLDEYIRQYDSEDPFEIYDRVLKPLTPNVTIHQWVIRVLFRLLDPYCVAVQLGEVFTALTLDRQWMKGSHVPDLVIEVVSPGDSYTDLQNKVEHYLIDWVRLFWIIDPQRKTVSIYQGDRFTALRNADILSGGDVIPGFQVTLTHVFPAESA